jgi:alpha-tubulin suppressor-like RCC1 family protein
MSDTFMVVLAVFILALGQENGPVTSRDGARPKRTSPAFLTVTRGTEHGCGLSAEGRAYCWGSNRLGQLGDDANATTRPTTATVAVATRETFTSISAGANHTCALTRPGLVYCWGLNMTGELGQALVANECSGFRCSRRPVRVETSVRFDTVSAGFGHTCALSEGRAFCWGRNDEGQLGNPRVDDSCEGVPCTVSPIPVLGVDSFTSIAAGGDHTCGIAGGAAYCWGSNQYGQLGLDERVRRTSRPTRLPFEEPVTSIEARGIRTCVTGASGRRACWGSPRSRGSRGQST